MGPIGPPKFPPVGNTNPMPNDGLKKKKSNPKPGSVSGLVGKIAGSKGKGAGGMVKGILGI